MKLSGGHTHKTDEGRFIKLKSMAKMKSAVKEQAHRGVKQVYAEVLVSTVAELRSEFADEEIGASVPNFQKACTTLHRQRDTVKPSV